MNTESGDSDGSLTGSEDISGLKMVKTRGIPVRTWVSARFSVSEEFYEIEHTVEKRQRRTGDYYGGR